MKFKNKILKLSLRYAKEKGQYCEYINKLRTVINTAIDNEEKIISSCNYQTPLLICERANFESQDIYSDNFIKYVCNLEQKKYLKLFNDFLKKNNAEKKYYERINKEYILRHLSPFNTIENIQNINEPFEILKITYPPIGYIMHAFHWEKTKEGFFFWSRLNDEWVRCFMEYIKKNI